MHRIIAIRIPLRFSLLAAWFLAVGLVSPISGLSTPVQAEETVARVKVTLHAAHIIDNNEPFGDGEIRLQVLMVDCGSRVCNYECSTDGCTGQGIIDHTSLAFDAASDSTTSFNSQQFPGPGDDVHGEGVSNELGIPIKAGHRYQFVVSGWESDPVSDDELGNVIFDIDSKNAYELGPHPERGGKKNGAESDFLFYYDIEPVYLPDLKPTDIRIDDVAGTEVRVCVSAINQGQATSGTFKLIFDVDGVDARDKRDLLTGVNDIGSLYSGESTEHCLWADFGGKPTHSLSLTVDGPGQVVELNEDNNALVQPYIAPSANVAPTGEQTNENPPSSADPVDLAVIGIRVKGQNLNGPNDCDPGKNQVDVTVANRGASATSFAVRLSVDGDELDGSEKSPNDLDPGKSADVTFDGVRLSKGDHTLKASVTTQGTPTDSNTKNNTLDLPVSCRDES